MVNLPFDELRADDRVAVLGRGRHCLDGYTRPNPIVAGIGLMTHPSEWPTLCDEYPVVRYLQHSKWANMIYEPYFGDRCTIWPVGIDTGKWSPKDDEKNIDILLYDKILWNRESQKVNLFQPIVDCLKARGLTYEVIQYGNYSESDLQVALGRCRAMIFLCEHESQGLAYQECLSSGVPLLAWDQGWCLDPNRFNWGEPEIAATSVPYWDDRCGEKFKSFEDFRQQLDRFVDRLNRNEFAPRDYILENLTLEKCSGHFLQIVNDSVR